MDDVLGYGWLVDADVQPGLVAFAAEYVSHEDYTICMESQPRCMISLYMGDGHRAEFGRREERLPSGHFSIVSLDETTPTRLYRGERGNQRRCSVFLDQEWINSGSIERYDDSGVIKKVLSQPGLFQSAAASPQMLTAASRLFAASCWNGPLTVLRREAAALGFFAEAFAELESLQLRVPAGIDVARMMRVKESLDNLLPGEEVRLIELAAVHDMSVRTLSRQFRRTFDKTVLGYVAERRMDSARVALERDEMTIDQAAYFAGFSHTTNFSLAFRRRYGYPPGKARSHRS